MKKTLYLLFALFSAVSITNAYASCYDVSSCSRELDDEENRRNSTQSCTHFLKSQNPISDSYDVCDRSYRTLALSSMSNFRHSGWEQVYENCYGSVWCHDRPTFSSSSSSSSNSSYSSNRYNTYTNIYSSSYNNDSSSDDDDSDLYFRSLSDKKGIYEIYKDNIDVGYYGNISYGYPDGNENIFYYDDLVYSGAFKLGTPSGTGVLFSKNGYLYGTWTYGVFKQQKIMSANLLPLTVNISGKSQKLANKMLYVKLYEIDADSSQGRLLLKRFNRSCRSYY